MPAYEYIHTVRGKEVGRVTLSLPVADRDAVCVTRSAIPASIMVPAERANATLRALSRIESRIGNSTEFARKLGMPIETVKRAWSDHDKRHAKSKD